MFELSLQNITFWLVALSIMATMVFCTGFAIYTMYRDYKYRTFSIEDEEMEETPEEIVENIQNPLDNTRFKISESGGGNEVIAGSRKAMKKMLKAEKNEKLKELKEKEKLRKKNRRKEKM